MLHRLLLITLGVVLIPVASYASIYGILSGKVTDDQKNPLVGATVLIEGTTKGGYTKPDGSFTILKVNAGSYTVRIKSLGFKDYTTQVRISPDETTKINASLSPDAKVTDGITITADKLADPNKVGSVRKVTELTNTPVESVQAVIAKQPGVQTGGNGFNIRGGRTSETQFRINGLDVNDQFSGGTGSSPTAYYPTVSSQATEEIQVITGGFSAEYGNALAGVVNAVTKTGKNDRYEGYLRFKTDVPGLYGSASNGLKYEAARENIYEFGGGGPIPLIDGMTFYLAGKYQTQKYRNNGLAVIDPSGNNLGAMPDQGLWIQNLNANIKARITDQINMEVGLTRGVSSWETSSWGWLYLNDFGMMADSSLNSVEERRAKQPVSNQILDQYYVRVNQSLNESSFYELTLSWNKNRFESSKRYLDATMSDFESLGLLSPFRVWEPRDEGFTDPSTGQIISKNDKALDQYWFERSPQFTKDGLLEKDLFVRNPLTGYFEGGEDNTSSNNPYGLVGPDFFTSGGNSRSFEFRQSTYLQLDGNYNNLIDGESFDHFIKAGFEMRIYSLTRHQNSLPWLSNPFFDVYTDEWGGNFYTDFENIKEVTSQPYEPIEAAVYLQDQIKYKGIIITPGVRVDLVDTRSLYRSNIENEFVVIQDQLTNTEAFSDSKMKLRVSPRIAIAYPITDRSNFSLSYGVFFQRPPFNNYFDGFNSSQLRGNQIIGNTDLNPQTVKMYQITYTNQLTDNVVFDVTAYFRDMYNIVGLAYVVPTAGIYNVPYSIYKTNDYGNARGIEISLRRLTTDNVGINLRYTLARARGTSSSAETQYQLVVLNGNDQYTNEKVTFPASEYYLEFDRTHRLNATVDFVWRDDEGPTVAGLKLLEHTRITLDGFFQTGTPFTLFGAKGGQVGEYLGSRQPSSWRIDSRIERDIPLKDLFGETMGNTTVTLFADIINVLNRTEPTLYYQRGGGPDNDGSLLSREIGNFSSASWYKDGDVSNPASVNATQYDNYGNRLYNETVDYNKDGVVTQEERYQGYQQFVEDVIARQGNYQRPRTVSFGVMLKF